PSLVVLHYSPDARLGDAVGSPASHFSGGNGASNSRVSMPRSASPQTIQNVPAATVGTVRPWLASRPMIAPTRPAPTTARARNNQPAKTVSVARSVPDAAGEGSGPQLDDTPGAHAAWWICSNRGAAAAKA